MPDERDERPKILRAEPGSSPSMTGRSADPMRRPGELWRFLNAGLVILSTRSWRGWPGVEKRHSCRRGRHGNLRIDLSIDVKNQAPPSKFPGVHRVRQAFPANPPLQAILRLAHWKGRTEPRTLLSSTLPVESTCMSLSTK